MLWNRFGIMKFIWKRSVFMGFFHAPAFNKSLWGFAPSKIMLRNSHGFTMNLMIPKEINTLLILYSSHPIISLNMQTSTPYAHIGVKPAWYPKWQNVHISIDQHFNLNTVHLFHEYYSSLEFIKCYGMLHSIFCLLPKLYPSKCVYISRGGVLP